MEKEGSGWKKEPRRRKSQREKGVSEKRMEKEVLETERESCDGEMCTRECRERLVESWRFSRVRELMWQSDK